MRVEEYRPEVPAESTEVRMTAFMTLAAPSTPARSKTSVKGLIETFSSEVLSRFGSV
jgi:hypothetical protein